MPSLDFPNPPLTSGQLWAAPNGATYKWDGTVWTGVAGAPPTGTASGDLSGTYPGPTVAKVNGAALGTTTPLARGDLLVANSTPALARLGLGASGTVLQSNGTDAVWGTSLGGPPTGTAGGDLQGTYPNPTIIPSHLPWTPSVPTGGTLTPTDATKIVTIPGASSTAYAEIVFGSSTAKFRVETQNAGVSSNPGSGGMFANREWSGNAPDDITKPSWGGWFNLASDNFVIQRAPVGSSTQTNLLTLDNGGNVTIAGMLTQQAAPYARITRSTAISIPNATSTNVTGFDTVQVNQGGMWNAANTDRLTIQVAGFYLVGAQGQYSNAAGGARRILSLITSAASISNEIPPTASGLPQFVLSSGLYLAAGGVLNVQAYQDSGAALNLAGVGLWAVRVA